MGPLAPCQISRMGSARSDRRLPRSRARCASPTRGAGDTDAGDLRIGQAHRPPRGLRGDQHLRRRLGGRDVVDQDRILERGDAYSYALASTSGEPLLFVGDDFSHTDLDTALEA